MPEPGPICTYCLIAASILSCLASMPSLTLIGLSISKSARHGHRRWISAPSKSLFETTRPLDKRASAFRDEFTRSYLERCVQAKNFDEALVRIALAASLKWPPFGRTLKRLRSEQT
jgi:hypothetical protein